jgi:hypothetical protein
VDSLGVVPDSFGWQASDPTLVDFRRDGAVVIEPFAPSGGDGADSIAVEYRSFWLEDQMDPVEWNLAEAERAEKAMGRAREVLAALRTHDSRLAAALESTHATSSQIRTVREELRAALRLPPGDAGRDLVVLATHLWTRQFADSLTKGRCADTDSTVLHNFNAAFSSFGGPLDCGYDDIWCFPGFLADSLASRVGTNPWTDFAFLERMEEGWSPQCENCGYDSIVGTDQFRPVIARGMAYLKTHPTSSISPEVRLMVAEAHETAWSNATHGNEYFERRYGSEASAHRLRAIEMYERYLQERPLDPRDGVIRLRLGRLRLGRSSPYYRYWCLWD